jgi:hypothetical protein
MKIIKLTESDLKKIVERVISEQKPEPGRIYGYKNSYVYNQTPSKKAINNVGKNLNYKIPQNIPQNISHPSDYFGTGNGYERHNFPERFARKEFSFEKCVPNGAKKFIVYAMANKDNIMKTSGINENTFRILIKAVIGIMGRETKFGAYTEKNDTYAEILRSNNLGSLVDGFINVYNWYRSKKGQGPITQSLGNSQFTPETWNRYGLDKIVGPYDESLGEIKQGLGTYYKLAVEFKKALKSGLSDGPSQNQILEKYGVVKSINGTGYHAIDVAIVSHNMPAEKLAVKYCTTNNPLYAAPCNSPTYTPFVSVESFNQNKSTNLLNKANVDPKYKGFPGTLKVNTGDVLSGYFPNLKGPNHTAIGYLEEVTGYMNSMTCF